MSIAIKPELERKIADKVKSGRYASADDVVEDALNLLDRVEEAEREWRRDARRAIEEGWEQIGRGETIPADLAFERVTQRIDSWERKKA
jgi:antitoxin ParD1/3/4